MELWIGVMIARARVDHSVTGASDFANRALDEFDKVFPAPPEGPPRTTADVTCVKRTPRG